MLEQQLSRQGYCLVPSIVPPSESRTLADRLEGRDGKPGHRERIAEPWCTELVQRLRQHPELQSMLTPDLVGIQCICFEKSSALNWLVSVHQDLSFPVVGRTAHPAWHAWSVKDGTTYVQPPQHVLEQLLAVRIHLDACGMEDGPLYVVPGTHDKGVISTDASILLREMEQAVLAAPGDALLMHPLLLHRSSKAKGMGRRRVLHFVFGPRTLPNGMAWQHTA